MIVEFTNEPLLFLGSLPEHPLDVYGVDISHFSREAYDLVMGRHGNLILQGDLLFPYKIPEDAGGFRVLVYQQGTLRLEKPDALWEALQAKEAVYLLCVDQQDMPELQDILLSASHALHVFILDATPFSWH